MLKKLTIAACVAMAATGGASAQNQTPEVSVQSLLNNGFTIVAMQYLQQSMVFTLQRHAVAYVCDTTLNGDTKICIHLK